MLIYNVTVKIDPSIEEEWIRWMKDEHIPEVLGTGKFFESRFARLLEVDETDGPTFSVQYTARTRKEYDEYIEQFATDMRKKGTEKWGNRFIAFRTVMKLVS